MKHIHAPFSPDQVESLNRYQRSGLGHPFTCGNNRGSKAHKKAMKVRGDKDLGVLVATSNGWVCPACSYTQQYAYDFMADPTVLDKMTASTARLYDALVEKAEKKRCTSD
jgi:DNA-binding NtrC family response regulator